MDKIVIVIGAVERSALTMPKNDDYQLALCGDINEGIRALDMVNGQVDAFIYNSAAALPTDWETLDNANIRYEDVVWVAYIGGTTNYANDLNKAFKAAYKAGAFDISELVLCLNSVIPSAT